VKASSLDIVELLKTKVFPCRELQEFTNKIHAGDIIGSVDTTHALKQTLCKGEINFIQFFVQRRKSEEEVGNCERYIYRVRIEYYREDGECDGVLNQNLIQKFFEVFDDTLESKVGCDLDGLVEHTQRSENFPNVRRFGVVDDSRIVFVGSYEYLAFN